MRLTNEQTALLQWLLDNEAQIAADTNDAERYIAALALASTLALEPPTIKE